MKLFGNQNQYRTGKRAVKPARRILLTASALALCAWTLLPVGAQHESAPPPPPPANDAHGSTALPNQRTPEASRAEETHLGAQEPGPGGSHGPQGGEHAVGEQTPSEPGHGTATDGHGEAGGGEHGDAHGGEHGEEHDKQVSIHNPTWLYRVLQWFWWSGPATLKADGALDAATGQPIPATELKGKTVPYTYSPHHVNIKPAPRVAVNPTIGEVGNRTSAVGVTTEELTIDGRPVVLLNPTVSFAFESMFPEGLVISLLTALTIFLVAVLLTRNLRRIPDRKQTVLEMIYSGFDGFVHGLIGENYKKYVPLIGTGFIYIWVMNLAGLIPGWMSPTSNINVTAGLAVVVVVYSHIEGIRVNGVKGYFMHFVGDPWWLGPLNVPIHIVGELAKILSLTIRLFGNIFGEDVVLVILMYLAAHFTQGLVPFQLPMYFLALFTCTVQALVFSILASVYIALMTAHGDHDEHHGEHAHHGDDHGHVSDHAAPAPAV
ncbi:MAG: F0F1 ATP synthase subunit A [Armatimonadota bacterium]